MINTVIFRTVVCHIGKRPTYKQTFTSSRRFEGYAVTGTHQSCFVCTEEATKLNTRIRFPASHHGTRGLAFKVHRVYPLREKRLFFRSVLLHSFNVEAKGLKSGLACCCLQLVEGCQLRADWRVCGVEPSGDRQPWLVIGVNLNVLSGV